MKARNSTSKKKGNPRQDSEESITMLPFPFTALVGQEEMKLGLVLNVIDPLIGGVLIMGHRGTGKSTAVRALADLLPKISAVYDCLYNCDPNDARNSCEQCRGRKLAGEKLQTKMMPVPVIELPLGATEDRVCGAIAIERALRDGVKTFEPGLLARANRGFLYIDEVNLLDDHIVDVLLDVAASGRNKVERESFSIQHPASFVLIGSGNPEEGELRPQLLDRFGLSVEVTTEGDLDQRVAVVERRHAYDLDPAGFRALFNSEQELLRKRITTARRTFAKVKLARPLLKKIAQLCFELKIDGHRGELTIMRAARALAALEGRRAVREEDIRRVGPLALRHRLRRNPLEETPSGDRIAKAFDEVFEDTVNQGDGGPDENSLRSNGSNQKKAPELSMPEGSDAIKFKMHLDGSRRDAPLSGQRRSEQTRRGVAPRGRHSRSIQFKRASSSIALAATLQAMIAAAIKSSSSQTLPPVEPDTFRYKLFTQRRGTLFIFAIDTSGSMASNRIAIAKAVMLGRLEQSYINRDSVAIVSFRGESAQVALSPSRSTLRARRVIDSLLMGGGTPLPAGLACTAKMINSIGGKYGDIVVLLFTDGHANVPLGKNGNVVARQQQIEDEIRSLGTALRKGLARVVVVDTQRAFESSRETRHLAGLLQGHFVKLSK